jgi:hypothetical protein
MTSTSQIEARAEADPASTDWQRDLSIGHNRLGDLARAAGDRATAELHYRTGLGIRERLAAADSGQHQLAPLASGLAHPVKSVCSPTSGPRQRTQGVVCGIKRCSPGLGGCVS